MRESGQPPHGSKPHPLIPGHVLPELQRRSVAIAWVMDGADANVDVHAGPDPMPLPMPQRMVMLTNTDADADADMEAGDNHDDGNSKGGEGEREGMGGCCQWYRHLH